MQGALSSMTDERCIQKCILMVIDNLGQLICDYIYEEKDEE
jgi:hypothetical protein